MRWVGSSTSATRTRRGAALRAALDLAGADLRLTVELLVQLAAVEYVLGRRREALELAERAEPIAEQVGDSALLALAVGAVAFFEGDLTGEIQSARFERAIALEEEAGTHIGEDSAAYDYGQELLDAWELEPARAIFQRLVATARADGHGDTGASIWTTWPSSSCVPAISPPPRRSPTRPSTSLPRSGARRPRFTPCSGWAGSRGCGATSMRHASRANGRSAWPPTRTASRGEPGSRSATWRARSSTTTRRGRTSTRPNPATGELPPERPVVHVPEMVEVLAALGRTDEARAKLAPFADRAAQLRRRWALARAAHCRGLILAADGDLEQPRARWRTPSRKLSTTVGRCRWDGRCSHSDRCSVDAATRQMPGAASNAPSHCSTRPAQ